MIFVWYALRCSAKFLCCDNKDKITLKDSERGRSN
jgi:hypothetical protein